ncbi:MAG: RHS repeat-associated core domain-containing protein [Bacteroidales bacterium]|jgi:RHS repeat-associated protein|nr:RHS repeat-associated core domain-containing protein [Bacteroidales bacterium]
MVNALNESYYDELMLSHRQPSRISHADGYVSLDENGEATFYYYLTDHLGNVRSVITPDADGKPQVEQANDYFPFGMSFESKLPLLTKSGSGNNKFKYNGKEEQEMPGGWLDYGARMYDPTLGRWHVVDDLLEEYQDQSPYNYVHNNPVSFNDPSGMSPEPISKTVVDPKGEIIYHDDSEDKGIYLSPDGIQGKDGDKSGLRRVGTEEPWINYRVGDYLLRDAYNNFTAMPVPYKPMASGALSNDYTFESLFIPVFGFVKYFKIGKYIYKLVPKKTSGYVIKLLGLSDDAAKGVNGLLKAGNALDKGGFTAVGRALQKHGSRAGSVFPKATGNPAAINAQGEAVLKGILTNPNATTVTRHHARFGNIMDIQIPGGQGARFSADGKTFIHFLEP